MSVCVGKYATGGKPEIVILDHAGQIEQRFAGAIRPQSLDVDGDGRDELVFVKDGKIQVTSGGNESLVWEWPLPGGRGALLKIQHNEQSRSATIVVRAGASNSLYGLDARTGAPLWVGKGQARKVQLMRANDPGGLPRILSREPAVICQQSMPIPSADHATFTQSSTRGITASSPTSVARLGDDPRHLRPLPWTHPSNDGWQIVLKQFFEASVTSLTVLVLPGWLMIWILRRRSFSLRRLLLVPVAVAISLASVQFVSTFSWFQSFYLPKPVIFVVYYVALVFLPILGFLGALGLWIVQRHWQRVVILLSLTVFMSLLLGGVILWIDSYTMDALEHYSWNRWYEVWFPGIYAAGGALLVVKLGQPFVLALWQTFRRCCVRY